MVLSADFHRSLVARPQHLVEFLARRGVRVTIVHPRRVPVNRADSLLRKVLSVLAFVFRHGLGERRAEAKVESIGLLRPPLPWALLPLQIALLLPGALMGLRGKDFSLLLSQGPVGGAVGTILRKAGIASFHVYEDLDHFAAFHKGIAERVVGVIERWILRNADALVTVSAELAELRRLQTGRPQAVVSNGVDYGAFAAGQLIEKAPEPTLIFVGTLEPWAGLDISLRAAAAVRERVPSLRYLVIGPGDQTALRELARDLSLDGCVTFLGPRPKEEIPLLLGRAKVALASFQPIPLMQYAFTLKVIEYMAAGLPVVGTDIGPTGRVIRESGAGFAVPCDPAEFARSIERLLIDSTLYGAMRTRAINYARGYEWELLFDREWEFITEVLSWNASPR